MKLKRPLKSASDLKRGTRLVTPAQRAKLDPLELANVVAAERKMKAYEDERAAGLEAAKRSPLDAHRAGKGYSGDNMPDKGQRVVLRADALPGQVLEGTVSDITPKGDPISRSYRVRIKVPNTKGLMAGMTVEANLVVTQRDKALLVPSSAVQKNNVWVVQNGAAHQQAIQVGIAGSSKTEVLSGLSDGVQVVTLPTAEITEGRRVRALQP